MTLSSGGCRAASGTALGPIHHGLALGPGIHPQLGAQESAASVGPSLVVQVGSWTHTGLGRALPVGCSLLGEEESRGWQGPSYPAVVQQGGQVWPGPVRGSSG